jgi:hypothetical protein
VYVVVAAGLTVCVPPVVESVYELPSVPITVTPVAFVAVTVRVDELPETIVVGLAVMATVAAEIGFTVTVAVAVVVPPVPVAVAV